jgi:hypothetical protein
MSWLRLDDNYADHPKIRPLSDKAFRLDVEGMLYCARFSTDGVVTTGVRALCALVGSTGEEVEELVSAGRWERAGNDLRIHDFLAYNRSRAQLEIDRSAAAARQQKSRNRVRSHAVNHASVTQPQPGLAHPIPFPDPDPDQAELQAGRQAGNDDLVREYCELFGVDESPDLRLRLLTLQEAFPDWPPISAFQEARRRRVKNPLRYVEKIYHSCWAEGRVPDSLINLAHPAGPPRTAREQMLSRLDLSMD